MPGTFRSSHLPAFSGPFILTSVRPERVFASCTSLRECNARLAMPSQTPTSESLMPTPVLGGRRHTSRSHSPADQGNHVRETLEELRHLVARSISNSDACTRSLNEFSLNTAEWNRQIFEHHVSSQKLQRELAAARQELVASQAALQQEQVECEALRQAAAADRDKTDELTVQLRACREANVGFIKVIAELSQALFNLTDLAGSEGG